MAISLFSSTASPGLYNALVHYTTTYLYLYPGYDYLLFLFLILILVICFYKVWRSSETH